MRPDHVDAPVMRIVSTGNPSVTTGFGFGVLEGGRLRFTRFGIYDHDTVEAYVEPGVWTHVAVAYHPMGTWGARFFVNGQFVESSYVPSPNEGTPSAPS